MKRTAESEVLGLTRREPPRPNRVNGRPALEPLRGQAQSRERAQVPSRE